MWRKTKTARTDILLLGPSDSGKTYLYSQLLFSEDKETFTSITYNTGIYNGEHVSKEIFFDLIFAAATKTRFYKN